jgi:hypothetical protein
MFLDFVEVIHRSVIINQYSANYYYRIVAKNHLSADKLLQTEKRILRSEDMIICVAGLNHLLVGNFLRTEELLLRSDEMKINADELLLCSIEMSAHGKKYSVCKRRVSVC